MENENADEAKLDEEETDGNIAEKEIEADSVRDAIDSEE